MSRMSARTGISLNALVLALGTCLAAHSALAADYPITSSQRNTAQQVAQGGVPLSALAPDAPERYTVKAGDTLWGISKLFLTSPWRWPELWGMNLEQIRNPHLIYPGQMLFLVKLPDGTARLTLGKPIELGRNDKLSPSARSSPLVNDAIPSVPMHLIGPFLNEAVVFETEALMQAPRIVATQEGRVMVSRGETAYVRGPLGDTRSWQIFREPTPLVDPETNEVLGFEARHVGSAELLALGNESPDGGGFVTPSTVQVTQIRLEAGVGDRLAPVPEQDSTAFAPHAPSSALGGRIISVYGDGLNAGQNQIVSLNRGRRDGIERGHVLALWRAGNLRPDLTDDRRQMMMLPDERHGLLFVFRVFERVSYALILSVKDPVKAGDRFSQP